MSKQDRCGVRTASDLERKYDFGNLSQSNVVKVQGQNNQTSQELAEFIASTNMKFAEQTNRMNQIESETNSKIQELEMIGTHFYSGVPTLLNDPAINWETDELKKEHIGDFYYDTSTEKLYLFKQTQDVYEWVKCTSEVTIDNGGGDSEHSQNKNNPHEVTKSQVGLGNVDNTSDLDKPISTAVQTALNGKSNTDHTHTIANVSNLQSSLDGKASSSHTHSISQITNLQTTLDGKAATHSHPYLSTSGGTISGTLTTTGDISTSAKTINYTTAYTNEVGLTCKWADGSSHNLITRSSNGLTSAFGYDGSSSCKTISILRGYSIRFGCAGNNGTGDGRGIIKFDYDGSNVYFRPTQSGGTYLGSSSYRWATIYTNASVNTSDRREKHDINYDVSDEMIDLVYNAKPVSFKYNCDEHEIKRYGFIAQDVRDYLLENNKEKFAGITVDDKVKEIPRDIDTDEEQVTYGISYEQYIAPLIATVQHQKQQIDGMQKEMNELKELVSQLLVK